MNKTSHIPTTTTNPVKRAMNLFEKFFFVSRETITDPDGQERRIRRTFRHKGPKLSELIECIPARRDDDTPLQIKHRRALDRALRRGRRSQIQRKVSRLTGIVFQ